MSDHTVTLVLKNRKYEPPACPLMETGFTSGGDSLPVPRLALTEAHYTQQDTSMNSKIWELFPIFGPSEIEAAFFSMLAMSVALL